MREIDLLIVHCSASDHKLHDNIEMIRKWHVEERGWSDVGYHYFIRKDGTLEVGRPISVQGAGVHGFNENSVHICVSGLHEFTFKQALALCHILLSLKERYPKAYVKPHNFFNDDKTCPNFNSIFLFRQLNKYSVEYS